MNTIEITESALPWMLPAYYGFAIFLGFVSLIAGSKLVKWVLSLTIALVFAGGLGFLGYAYTASPIMWAVIGVVAGLILGGILAVFFFNLAVAIVGAVTMGMLLLPWVQDLADWLEFGILGLACSSAAIVAIILTQVMIRLVTSFAGGFLFVFGCAYFINGTTTHSVLRHKEEIIIVLTASPLLTLTAVGLGLGGFAFQTLRKS